MDTGRRRVRLGLALAVAVALGVLAGAAWWSWSRGGTQPGGSEEARPPGPSDRPSAATLLAGQTPHSGARVGESGAAVEPSADLDEDLDGYLPAPVDGPVRVTIRYVGAGDPPEVLDLLATPVGDGGSVRARLSRGVFEARLPPAPGYWLVPVLDGWRSDQSVKMDVPPDQRMALEVSLPGTPTLRVVDAHTGAPLPSARAWDSGWEGSPWQPVPPPGVLAKLPSVADTEGRIVFSKTACTPNSWIGAGGYAWTLVQVAPGDLDRRVELDSGGGIRVEVEGVEDWAAFGVALTSSPPTPGTETPAEPGTDEPIWAVLLTPTPPQGRYVIDGLRPGRWHVQVGWKGPWGIREVLRTAAVEVRAGETTECRVRVSEAAPATTTIDLAVVVPGAWAVVPTFRVSGVGERTRGELDLARQPHFVRGPPGTWVSRLEKIPAGPYAVFSDELRFGQVIRVGSATKYLRVLVPTPVMLRVKVIDDRTGAPVPDATVAGGSRSYWGDDTDSEEGAATDPPDSDGTWVGAFAPAKCDAKAGEVTLSVPEGPIELQAQAPGYVEDRSQAVASAGLATIHEIRLSRAGTLFLRVLRDGFPITRSPGDFFSLAPLEVDGLEPGVPLVLGDFEPASTKLEGLRAGSYRVRVRVQRVVQEFTKNVDIRGGEERTVTWDLPAK